MIRLLNKYPIFGFLLFSACNPDPLPPPVDEQPVFKIVGTLGNAPLNISAGVDGYYLDTEFEKDNLDMFVFKGAFKKANCTNCTEEMTISIRDRKIMKDGANFIRDLSLRSGSYSLESTGQQPFPKFLFQFYQFFSNTTDPFANPNYEYLWVFNGVDSSTSPQPIFYFPDKTGQSVKLTVTDPVQGCSDTWENSVGFTDFPSGCPFVTFSYDNPPSDPVNFVLPFLDSDIISSDWDFGDSNSMQFGSEPVISHLYATPGIYNVCVDVVLQGGCPDSFCSRVQSHRGEGCAAGFDYCPCLFEPYFFSNVLFDWVSADGKVYSSFETTSPQPSDSFFEITEIELFDDDLDGQKTMKVTARAKATLFDVDDPSDSIVLETDELVFAVAYPNL